MAIASGKPAARSERNPAIARAMASSPTEPTGCEKCCAPGGDCSHAFKGSPGKCCGIREGVSYCCPGEAYRGYQSGDAKCYDCGEVYRCFVGSNQGQICGAGTPTPFGGFPPLTF